MTESTVLSPTQLEAFLPHRGVNLLPDEMVLNPDGRSGLVRIEIHPGDERGREIFGRDDGAGGRAWQEPYLAEYVALLGVALIHERLAAEGKEGVYSAISRVESNGLVALDRPVEGRAEITRDRGAFTQFRGCVIQDGVERFHGEFIAGSAPLAEIASRPVDPGEAIDGEALVADFSWKPASMRFIDQVVSWDAAEAALVCSYTYPEDHPFVPGHFPEAALMMGVSQWQAIYDAGVEAAARAGLTGDVVVDGRIRRADGSEIVDVRELVIGHEHGVPVLRGTKRVAFREPVRPGDGMLVEVTARAV